MPPQACGVSIGTADHSAKASPAISSQRKEAPDTPARLALLVFSQNMRCGKAKVSLSLSDNHDVIDK